VEHAALDAFKVAVATPGDHAAITAILEDAQRWLVSRGTVQWTAPFTEEWIEQKIAGGEFHVARVGGIPIGTLRLLWADPLFWGDRERGDAAYIHTMAVRRDYAGRGNGARLLDWAAAQAIGNGRRFLRLDCGADNSALGAYYRRLGFTPQGSVGVGSTRVTLFEKELSA
jgi:GNAT superfamily N-acetyltransferase